MNRMYSLALVASLALACSNKPQSAGNRASGQSRLIEQTAAGADMCDPANHKRPFIIEWDATDMSSFEQIVNNDIVLVRYEGCTLTVLDECRNESIRGSQGAYLPPEWTSGSLETIDISNEGELYAKLPLGSASLGGRVSGGEKFHMEYFVAGTRQATRDAVYTEDLKSNPGCEGATHFVHSYNLGAFALGSAQELNTEAGGSVYGFGAGGSTSSKRSADKKGGDLATCKSDSAQEIQGCKAPIRLSLREVREGENPEQAAMTQPDDAASLNAAGKVDAKVEAEAQSKALLESAMKKVIAGDGKGCLADLNAHDKLDPTRPSTDPKVPYAHTRSRCLMLAGQCDAGKKLMTDYFAAQGAMDAKTIDTVVKVDYDKMCGGK
ncbi:MAG: hypothetical protein ACE37F_36350 [Nannocystaceae bacterium]|nr:hypothetical protein [bacterium]